MALCFVALPCVPCARRVELRMSGGRLPKGENEERKKGKKGDGRNGGLRLKDWLDARMDAQRPTFLPMFARDACFIFAANFAHAAWSEIEKEMGHLERLLSQPLAATHVVDVIALSSSVCLAWLVVGFVYAIFGPDAFMRNTPQQAMLSAAHVSLIATPLGVLAYALTTTEADAFTRQITQSDQVFSLLFFVLCLTAWNRAWLASR
ncbi:hypothetical protein FVE85_0101 [Porphyridium purpureum]|uniref:Uncharacterized protein n=1 Tax=Porphyridium purpureum TaxID=35688 RepID=A0A5J4YZY5_PORPP|nr:hypothetical protein FVE85_0101 [Porphyridium purpureum]|eukprot:POR7567..scf208_2